jgi:phosphodiesterase/alkaline phosphatase D-like protein
MPTRRSLLAGTATAALAATGYLVWSFPDKRAVASGSKVRSLWTGAVTSDSVTATVVTEGLSVPVRLVAAPAPDFADRTYSEAMTPDPEHFYCRGRVEGLAPGTAYHLGVEVDGRIETNRIGRFRTPAAGAHSFRFATGSCARTGSEAIVFDNIRQMKIDFFMHLGDLHYENIDGDEEALFHAAYDEVFDSTRQNACWRDVPMYYMWDDHDYSANNGNRWSVSRRAAVAAYRDRVPSPPLAEPGPLDPIYYAFVRGRVRFVVSDLRSERTPNMWPDEESRSMLGETQFAWLQDQVAAARAAGEVMIWVSSVPWISEPSEPRDRWADFGGEQRRIVNIFRDAGMLRSIAILSGDMHALAYDDGSHAPGGLPVMHAAPLDRGNTEKGGPYTVGPVSASESQYGLIDCRDQGGREIAIRFQGIAVDKDTGVESVQIDRSFTLAAGIGGEASDRGDHEVPESTRLSRRDREDDVIRARN